MPAFPSSHEAHDDPLKQYVSTVHGLHGKLARITANQQEVAASLGRAAAALRSLAQGSKPGRASVFGK